MRILIGIDPGVKTGLAVYADKKLQLVESCTAVKAESFILKTINEGESIVLFIEDSRLRTWYGSKGREVAQGVGSVKRDCLRWQEFCEHHNIEFNMVHPKNNKTKLKAAEFKKITGWKGKSNEHGRDASMLVFGVDKKRER